MSAYPCGATMVRRCAAGSAAALGAGQLGELARAASGIAPAVCGCGSSWRAAELVSWRAAAQPAAGARAAGCAELLELAGSGWQRLAAVERVRLEQARGPSLGHGRSRRGDGGRRRRRSDGRLESSRTVAAALPARWLAAARRRLPWFLLTWRFRGPWLGHVRSMVPRSAAGGDAVPWPGKPGRTTHRKDWRSWSCWCCWQDQF